MIKLGVNIDHVATLRQARRETDPDPISAALICQQLGVHSIVAHLREDRRHIQDMDVVLLKKSIKIRFNLEMSIAPDIVQIALDIHPHQVTLVPERRQEVTTEGGLDVCKNLTKLKKVCQKFHDKGIDVSLFVAPDKKQIDASKSLNVAAIELHTGSYAKAFADRNEFKELHRLKQMTAYAQSKGLIVNAGHGLNYHNVGAIAKIKGMNELNIGHSIVSRAVFVGLKPAVQEMLKAIKL